MERALRERQRECQEQKQKLLERYSQVSKQQAGKFIFCIFFVLFWFIIINIIMTSISM